jgi:dipeptide/tripeptide permease
VKELTTRPAVKLTWRFPPTFWFANGAELCERAAYYGMFISLFRYLNDVVGFTTVQTGYISAAFAASLYLLPTFMGILADRIGFRRALLLAFALLTAGYGLLGAFQLKTTVLCALALIALGGAIVKPVISGTVARCSDSDHRARAMSIFYMIVNIGSFSGKGLAGYLNDRLGLAYINLYAAGMAAAAWVLVALFYREVGGDTTGGRSAREAARDLLRVVKNFRFLSLIILVGGFWAIQNQLYASMPTYIERVLGRGYKPEWLANINPLVVVVCVVPITHLVHHMRPENSIGIALGMVPFTALLIAAGPALENLVGPQITLGPLRLHPLIPLFIIGIGLQGLAECFLSPKWLEYVSKQAPPDQVGLYLGYSYLTSFFAQLFSFILAGYLLAGFCPDPRTLTPQMRHQWRRATDPHYQFCLDPAFKGKLDHEGPVDEAVRAAFEEQGIKLPQAARVRFATSGPPGNNRTWHIEAEGLSYTIQEATAGPDAHSELAVFGPPVRTASERPPLPHAYRHAHYLWLTFAAVGLTAFGGLMLFKQATAKLDRRRVATV